MIRALVIAGLCAFLVACGTVEPSNDAGTNIDAAVSIDAAACQGMLVDGGGCACPPRMSPPPACDMCVLGWRGAACSEFFDDFNRVDGPVGPAWLETSLVDPPQIVTNRACGDVQAGALVAEAIDSERLSATMTFESQASEGMESYFVVSDQVVPINSALLVGCDGGNGANTCTLSITDIFGGRLAAQDIAGLSSTVTYTLAMDLDATVMTVTLSAPGMVLGTVNADLGPYRAKRVGVAMGRAADDLFTCVDDVHFQIF